MLIDCSDQVINICEINFSKSTAAYLHNNLWTKTKYKGMIQSEVTMDDLFQL